MYLDVQGTFDQVCRFLGLPAFTLPSTRPFNAITRSPIPADLRVELEDFYSGPNRALADYLGRPLLWP
jgi:hypothetical protein